MGQEDKAIETLVKRINEEIDKKGKSIVEIVRESNLNYETVRNFREGKPTNFNAGTLKKMREVAGITEKETEEILSGTYE